jgi:hypothetical protein
VINQNVGVGYCVISEIASLENAMCFLELET